MTKKLCDPLLNGNWQSGQR